MVNRKSLIVYFKTKKVLDNINPNVNVYYISQKRNYAVLYMDSKLCDKVKEELTNMKGVKTVVESKFELETF